MLVSIGLISKTVISFFFLHHTYLYFQSNTVCKQCSFVVRTSSVCFIYSRPSSIFSVPLSPYVVSRRTLSSPPSPPVYAWGKHGPFDCTMNSFVHVCMTVNCPLTLNAESMSESSCFARMQHTVTCTLISLILHIIEVMAKWMKNKTMRKKTRGSNRRRGRRREMPQFPVEFREAQARNIQVCSGEINILLKIWS